MVGRVVLNTPQRIERMSEKMKTNRMWLKRAAMLSVMAACGLMAIEVIADDDADIRAKWEKHRQLTGEDLFAAPKNMATSKSALEITNLRASQRVGTRLVDVYYDLLSSGDYQCNVSMSMKESGNAVALNTYEQDGDIGEGVVPGTDKHIVWNAGVDWPGKYSEKFQVSLTATETDIPKTWATITISWASYGGKDLDICGYWVDQPSIKVGYGHGSGSTDSTYRSRWKGDNTGSGPEYVLVGVNENDIASGVTTRKYRIHFNYYNTAGSPAKADVSVRANGVTKRRSSSASTRKSSPASTSDPYVTITFDSDGTPISID